MRIECCGGEEPLTEELLNSIPILAGLGTHAVCEINEVDAVGVNDGECSGAVLGARTCVGRMVTKLEKVTGFSKR